MQVCSFFLSFGSVPWKQSQTVGSWVSVCTFSQTLLDCPSRWDSEFSLAWAWMNEGVVLQPAWLLEAAAIRILWPRIDCCVG